MAIDSPKKIKLKKASSELFAFVIESLNLEDVKLNHLNEGFRIVFCVPLNFLISQHDPCSPLLAFLCGSPRQ